jgi:hypothetical protein
MWRTVRCINRRGLSHHPPGSFNDRNNNHYPDSCDIAIGTSLDINLNSTPDECENQCGDANADATVDIADAVYLIAYIFSGGSAPSPLLAGDANCDSTVDISDAVYLIGYTLGGGPAPCAGC